MSCNVISIVNQKGGVGKTTTCVNLGVGLAKQGNRVLLVDCDPQGSLTISLGNPKPDQLPVTLSTLLEKHLKDLPTAFTEGILHHEEGIDYIPSNIELSGLEVALVNAMNREKILKEYLYPLRQHYDYILMDCMPSLGMLTINALVAADSVIIPVQAQYLSAKGLEQLLQTVRKVKRHINPKITVDGILMTMVDGRTNDAKEVAALLRETYGTKLNIFDTSIPHSVRAPESTAYGCSLFKHDPKSKVTAAYDTLTKEVQAIEIKREKNKPYVIR